MTSKNNFISLVMLCAFISMCLVSCSKENDISDHPFRCGTTMDYEKESDAFVQDVSKQHKSIIDNSVDANSAYLDDEADFVSSP